ncbi:hypothetical protein [Mesobacillus boroniphilus]|uniref:Uncharacterized protein n=1 Tax=Mesobacillus boroniphilus JCM 21738 TaxID=1294265 RepID=W4RPB2_9BACI|nr:hypothetical protein [Mesobacillus boroniphilus]GAE46275.1 hypothetical protein JCM21738_3164 [Mesobacillus boroniphilus JCM 21738]
MKLNVKNLPLFNKILMFSFMITTVVVLSTMGTSFYLQSKQLKTQMADKLKELQEFGHPLLTLMILEVLMNSGINQTLQSSGLRSF